MNHKYVAKAGGIIPADSANLPHICWISLEVGEAKLPSPSTWGTLELWRNSEEKNCGWDVSYAPELWSASCICANIKKLHFAFKEGQVFEFSNLSIELQEACLCYELIKFILNSDKCNKREILVSDWFGQWMDLEFMTCQHRWMLWCKGLKLRCQM